MGKEEVREETEKDDSEAGTVLFWVEQCGL
jgi:hypothetical protein